MGLEAIPLSKLQVTDENADSREERDVHEVYETIAPHFSSTRYKAWPIVERFLSEQEPYSLGLDSGAGNGKYMAAIRRVSENRSWMIGLDRSSGLLAEAQKQDRSGEECIRADLCYEGWRAGVFDFAISIAAIHHLSTSNRRQLSVSRLLASLIHNTEPPYSRFLIYVWAFEQGDTSKRKMGVRAVDSDGVAQQDVMVPWMMPASAPGTPSVESKHAEGGKVLYRYYHLFKDGELDGLVVDAATSARYTVLSEASTTTVESGMKWLRIIDRGYERDNWWLQGEVGAVA